MESDLEKYRKSKILVWIYKNIYRKIFPGLRRHLKNALSDCQSVLDLSCGKNSPIQYCNIPYSVGVEIFQPYLEESKKKKIHTKYIKKDIKKLSFKSNSFDAVIALDVLEHLRKEDGYELIERMEIWARKKIIIFTPHGYTFQDDYNHNPFQIHKSGWQIEDLQKLGFKVFGMNGWKKLRKGYRSQMRYKPIIFWELASELTQKIAYFCPRIAFQIFAIKELKKEYANKK